MPEHTEMRLCINNLPQTWGNGVKALAGVFPTTPAHTRGVVPPNGVGHIHTLSAMLVGLIVFTSLGIPARTQDTVKIVDQYIKAAGGVKALSRIQTLAIEGTCTSASDRKAGTFTLYLKSPNRYYSEMLVGDRRWIEAYNGKSAWREDATGAVATMLGPGSAQLEAAGQYYNARFLDLKKNKLALSLTGHARVGGQDAWQIEVTAANGVKRQVYFDAETHLIAEEKATLGGVEETVEYGDYRSHDGLMLPYRMELRRGDETYDIAAVRIQANGAVEDRVFDFPGKSQVPLPDMQALFKKIEANQKAIRKIKENYAGTRTEEETEYAGAAVKKVETSQYTFFYLDGEEVSTLVKKGGKALSAEEQKKEDEKTRKRVEELQNRAAKKEAKAEKDLEQGKEEKGNDHPRIEVFLRACRFVNPRRERFRGRDVLVFDFEPNPAYAPHDLKEKVVENLAGTVWIDEAALNVARLQAHFVGDVRIAAGLLANVQKGTSMVFEQAFVKNEVWLPTYVEADVGVRVLMLKGIKMSQVVHYSDYKKFNVQTLATIGKPNAGAEKAGSAPTPP